MKLKLTALLALGLVTNEAHALNALSSCNHLETTPKIQEIDTKEHEVNNIYRTQIQGQLGAVARQPVDGRGPACQSLRTVVEQWDQKAAAIVPLLMQALPAVKLAEGGHEHGARTPCYDELKGDIVEIPKSRQRLADQFNSACVRLDPPLPPARDGGGR